MFFFRIALNRATADCDGAICCGEGRSLESSSTIEDRFSFEFRDASSGEKAEADGVIGGGEASLDSFSTLVGRFSFEFQGALNGVQAEADGVIG